MAKEKKKLFEDMVFDDVAYARCVVDDCEEKLAKIKRGVRYSIFVILFDIVWFLMMLVVGAAEYAATGEEGMYVTGGVMQFTGPVLFFVAPFIAYLISGALIPVLKLLCRVTRIAWQITPIILLDLFVAYMVFACGGMIALLFPLPYLLLYKYQINKEKKEAEEYLSFCRPVSEVQS